MKTQNGGIRWVPNAELRARFDRNGIHLPDVLTAGHAGNDKLGRFVQFKEMRLAVDGKPDLEKIWHEAMSNGA